MKNKWKIFLILLAFKKNFVQLLSAVINTCGQTVDN